MSERLFGYFQNELRNLRDLGQQFAEEYPKVAGRLQLSRDVTPDPHVERLIEAVALISARLQLKLDDDFARISETVLEHIYPHLAKPMPPHTIVQMKANPAEVTEPYDVPGGTPLASKPLGRSSSMAGLKCQFRTCYPVRLMPVDIEELALVPVQDAALPSGPEDVEAVLSIRFRRWGDAPLGELDDRSLRFFVDGDAETASALHELLMTGIAGVYLRDGRSLTKVEDVSAGAVGFAESEGLLRADPRSHLGYSLLREYLVFPEKFRFVDLKASRPIFEGAGHETEMLIALRRFPRREWTSTLIGRIDARNLVLGCTPAVNLFPVVAEPIRVDPGRERYVVHPDLRRPRGIEVHEIERVTLVNRDGGVKRRRLAPLFGVSHDGIAETETQAGDDLPQWTFEREAAVSGSGDRFYLWLIDGSMSVYEQTETVATVETLCTNRDLAARLPVGNPTGDLYFEGNAPISTIVCLRKPSRTIRWARRDGDFWRLVSTLALSYVSLVDAGGAGLRQLLQAYNGYDPAIMPREHAEVERQISGVLDVKVDRAVERIGPATRRAFVQGVEVTVTVDESCFTGSAYLFATVLDRFLALMAGANSFTRLTVASRQREKELGSWAPRVGDSHLI